MKTLGKILFWIVVQIGCIAILYKMRFIPSRVILDYLCWGGLSGLTWALSYMIYFVPYCVLICIIYTIVGVLVTRKVPFHSKKWWIIAASCYVTFLIITGVGFYLIIGYTFYDAYGAAIIDVWIAPLLWLGEVELFHWIAKIWKRPALITIFVAISIGTSSLTGCTPKSPTKSLSEYWAEAQVWKAKEDSVRMAAKLATETAIEKVIPVVHIKYDTPVEGYDIHIEWFPTDGEPYPKGKAILSEFGEAVITLINRSSGVEIPVNAYISIPQWLYNHEIVDEDSLVLHYVPVPHGKVIPEETEQVLLFTDVDFDGEKELVVNSYRGGAQGANSYEAFKLETDRAMALKYQDNEDWNDWFQDYRIEFIPEKKQFIHWMPFNDDIECRIYQFDGTGSAPVLIETRMKQVPESTIDNDESVSNEDTPDLAFERKVAESEITSIIKGNSLRLFREERKAYQLWRDYQQTVSWDVCGILWELYVGGSAFNSLDQDYYDKLDSRNREDIINLRNLLNGTGIGFPDNVHVKLDSLDVLIVHVLDQMDYCIWTWQEAGTGKILIPERYDFDSDFRIKAERILRKDMALFRNWITTRKAFAKTLSQQQKRNYDLLTDIIISARSDDYSGQMFIYVDMTKEDGWYGWEDYLDPIGKRESIPD